MQGLLPCADRCGCYEIQKCPWDPTTILICSSATICNITYRHPAVYFLFTFIFFALPSPAFFHNQPPGTDNFRSPQPCSGNQQHKALLGKQCQQQLPVASKASNHSEVVWVPQLQSCLLPIIHTEVPKASLAQKKKSVLYVILSKYVVQLISKNLLACWAGHMLKYFPETAPATTSPALIPSLPTSSQGGRATWGQWCPNGLFPKIL